MTPPTHSSQTDHLLDFQVPIAHELLGFLGAIWREEWQAHKSRAKRGEISDTGGLRTGDIDRLSDRTSTSHRKFW